MPPSQSQVDSYLASLRSNRAQAQSTFESDSAEIKVYESDQVLVELVFTPEDADSSGEIEPDEKHTSEQAAIDAAEDLRGFGADDVNIHCNEQRSRVLATFTA